MDSIAPTEILILCPRTDRRIFIEPLHACLDRLEPKQKLVIHLRFWEEMEISKIAIITESNWDHVNHLLEKTILQLGEMLTEHLQKQTRTAKAA